MNAHGESLLPLPAPRHCFLSDIMVIVQNCFPLISVLAGHLNWWRGHFQWSEKNKHNLVRCLLNIVLAFQISHSSGIILPLHAVCQISSNS
jgi:hypothetical protein